MVSGTPSAAALPEPKLRRMSPRTAPAWVRTLGPLVPSAGYGPAVSRGIGPGQLTVVTAAVELVAKVEAAVDVVVGAVEAVADDDAPVDSVDVPPERRAASSSAA